MRFFYSVCNKKLNSGKLREKKVSFHLPIEGETIRRDADLQEVMSNFHSRLKNENRHTSRTHSFLYEFINEIKFRKRIQLKKDEIHILAIFI